VLDWPSDNVKFHSQSKIMTQQNKSFLKKLGEHLSLKEEVNYKLSFSSLEAEERLRDVLDKPPALDALGIGYSLKQKIVGTVNEGKVYVARYTSGTSAQVNYGCFKGMLVEESGSTNLKGSYEYNAKGRFIFITLFWIVLELFFLGTFISCFKEGSFSDCEFELGLSVLLPVIWVFAFLGIRGMVVSDWEMLDTLIRKLLVQPEPIVNKKSSSSKKKSPTRILLTRLIQVIWVLAICYTGYNQIKPYPKEGVVLSKERAAEFVQLYTKKRDVISECIKKAEPSIETKEIDYRGEYDYRRYGDGGYLGTAGCGSGNNGSFDYKIDKEIINIKLHVEWDTWPRSDWHKTVFKKLTSPEQMTCVKDFFAAQGINLYLDYVEYPDRKFNIIDIVRGKDEKLFGNFYDVKNNRDLDDNQFCAMTVRHIALLLGAMHGGRPCYDGLNGESPFFQFKDDYEHFLEKAKKDTNELFLTERELKNILSPTNSEMKVCELDDKKTNDPVKWGFENGNPLLITHYENNNKEEASLLIKNGGNINGWLVTASDKIKEPLLHIATREGKLDWVEFLLDHGADIDGMGAYGRRPLYLSVREKNIELTRFLIQRGALLNVRYDGEGSWNKTSDTLLHTAALVKSIEIAKLLISNGLGVNYKNARGDTPLFRATPRSASEKEVEKTVEMIKFLLANGADINAKNQYKETLLYRTLSQSASGKEKDRMNKFVFFLKANGAQTKKGYQFN
jgi:ankyrin repeat protein